MNQFKFSTLTETEGKVLSEVKKEKTKNLVLYNDDINTFEFVIQTLVDICDHNPLQAEQCAYIVHHNGKCVVKISTYKELEPLYKAILNRGLTVTIE